MQVSAADECTVNTDRIEQTGDAYHTGSGRGQLHAAEARAIEFIGPLERNQAILVMSGCSKAFAVAEVFIFHDETIHRICEVFGLHDGNCISNVLPAVPGIQKDIWNNRETAALQKLLLRKLALRLQMVADQFESPELQPALACLTGVKLSRAAGGQVPWMGIGLLQTGIDSVEAFPRDNALSAYLKRFLRGDRQWHVSEGAHRMGHILADDTLAAAGDGLLQFSVLIPQNQRKPVHLPAQQNSTSCCKPDHILNGLRLACGQHGLCMPHLRQAFQNLSGNLLRRRAGKHQPGIMLQSGELLCQSVIFQIRHNRSIVFVVGDVRLREPLDQFAHPFQIGIVLFSHSASPFC